MSFIIPHTSPLFTILEPILCRDIIQISKQYLSDLCDQVLTVIEKIPFTTIYNISNEDEEVMITEKHNRYCQYLRDEIRKVSEEDVYDNFIDTTAKFLLSVIEYLRLDDFLDQNVSSSTIVIFRKEIEETLRKTLKMENGFKDRELCRFFSSKTCEMLGKLANRYTIIREICWSMINYSFIPSRGNRSLFNKLVIMLMRLMVNEENVTDSFPEKCDWPTAQQIHIQFVEKRKADINQWYENDDAKKLEIQRDFIKYLLDLINSITRYSHPETERFWSFCETQLLSLVESKQLMTPSAVIRLGRILAEKFDIRIFLDDHFFDEGFDEVYDDDVFEEDEGIIVDADDSPPWILYHSGDMLRTLRAYKTQLKEIQANDPGERREMEMNLEHMVTHQFTKSLLLINENIILRGAEKYFGVLLCKRFVENNVNQFFDKFTVHVSRLYNQYHTTSDLGLTDKEKEDFLEGIIEVSLTILNNIDYDKTMDKKWNYYLWDFCKEILNDFMNYSKKGNRIKDLPYILQIICHHEHFNRIANEKHVFTTMNIKRRGEHSINPVDDKRRKDENVCI